MILHDLTDVPRSRALCPSCEATPAGCRGVRGLRGTYCCAACDERSGDHDQPPKGVNAPDSGPVATSARPTDGSERVISSRTDLPAPSHLPGRNHRAGRVGGTDFDTTTEMTELHP